MRAGGHGEWGGLGSSPERPNGAITSFLLRRALPSIVSARSMHRPDPPAHPAADAAQSRTLSSTPACTPVAGIAELNWYVPDKTRMCDLLWSWTAALSSAREATGGEGWSDEEVARAKHLQQTAAALRGGPTRTGIRLHWVGSKPLQTQAYVAEHRMETRTDLHVGTIAMASANTVTVATTTTPRRAERL